MLLTRPDWVSSPRGRGEHPIEQLGERLVAVGIEPAVEKRGMRVVKSRRSGTQQR